MATDIARLSFDSSRRYTGVVPQQGRVTLEAEQGEDRMIAARARRLELVDIIGPAGTPDDGYQIGSPGPGAITVKPGTMYVGGNRVDLPTPLDLFDQPDWLDGPSEPVVFKEPRAHVLLLVSEREVTAVEDPALREPALGGPDGAARSRLVQHVQVREVESSNCAGALAEDLKGWAGEGLTFDPATAELRSNGRLQVSWQTPAGAADPCEPAATGGYLGAENQVIRIQITAVDAAKGSCELIWGYDNASMLYRVAVDSKGTTLTLEQRPVDEHHWPRAGQAVQVLRSTARLRAADGVDEGFVAARGGHVALLATSFEPGTKEVSLPAPLPGEYADGRPTYLRVWKQLLTGVRLGTTMVLGDTGVQITLTSTGGPLRVDDYWCVGVRPGTPTEVLPARLLRAPQPPDGPLVWACPLAVIDIGRDRSVTVLDDCRRPYPPPIPPAGGGCCTIEVHPEDAKAERLQALIDEAVKGRPLVDRADRITICFAPGHYELTAPIRLGKEHSSIRLKACSAAAVITAAKGAEERFRQGLVVLVDAVDVTISGFDFRLPPVPVDQVRVRSVPGGIFDAKVVRGINAATDDLGLSIGIRPISCPGLAITDCRFGFGEGAVGAVGMGIVPVGSCRGFRILRNEFHDDPRRDGGGVLLGGFVLMDLGTSSEALTGKPGSAGTHLIGDAVWSATLDDAEFAGNSFTGIFIALAAKCTLGSVRVWDNVFRRCGFGIVLETSDDALVEFDADFPVRQVDPRAVAAIRWATATLSADPARAALRLLVATHPLPDRLGPVTAQATVLDLDRLADLRQLAAERRAEWRAGQSRQVMVEHPARDQAGGAGDFRAPSVPRELPTTVRSGLDGLAELIRVARLDESPPLVSLSVVRNDVDGPSDGGAGAALIVAIVDRSFTSTAVIADNRFASPTAALTAAVTGVANMSMVGNVCLAVEGGMAMYVDVVLRPALSGNVFAGVTSLPVRLNVAAPDTWEFLNDVQP